MFLELPGLLAEGPSTDIPSDLRIYQRMIGDWDLVWRRFSPDGTIDQATGEWFFRWALDGWAVQDTWICPSRAERRGAAPPKGEWGTTIRVYDPKINAWRITWNGPRQRGVLQFIGRPVGDDIVQEGTNALGQLMQWNFTDIQPDSFTWRSQVSEDGGSKWRVEVEMRVTRRAAR